MKLNHVSDDAIQQYALDEASCEAAVINHISSCESCNAKAENYQLLFTKLAEQPKPIFDFDVAQLVLPQLPEAKPALQWARIEQYSIIAIISIIVAGTLYIFRRYLVTMLNGMASYAVYTIVAAMIIIIVYKVYDMYKKYQQQLNKLNFY